MKTKHRREIGFMCLTKYYEQKSQPILSNKQSSPKKEQISSNNLYITDITKDCNDINIPDSDKHTIRTKQTNELQLEHLSPESTHSRRYVVYA